VGIRLHLYIVLFSRFYACNYAEFMQHFEKTLKQYLRRWWHFNDKLSVKVKSTLVFME